MSNDNKIVAIGTLIVVLGSMFYATVKTSTPRISDTPKPKQSQNLYTPVSNDQIQEMRAAYTQVLTETLKPICVDTAIRNEIWVNVYVNSLWYELNKGQKTEFINRCKNTYAGMLGARGIKVNFNTVNIFINLQGSEKRVGKYSGISGISIFE